MDDICGGMAVAVRGEQGAAAVEVFNLGTAVTEGLGSLCLGMQLSGRAMAWNPPVGGWGCGSVVAVVEHLLESTNEGLRPWL